MEGAVLETVEKGGITEAMHLYGIKARSSFLKWLAKREKHLIDNNPSHNLRA